jgi:hypothetical protein
MSFSGLYSSGVGKVAGGELSGVVVALLLAAQPFFFSLAQAPHDER